MDAADPTQAQFAAYRAMWDYFNVTLFGGACAGCSSTSRAAPRALGSSPPSAGRAARPARLATPAVSASRSGSGRRDHDARLCETKMRALRSQPCALRVARSAASAARRLWSFQTAKAVAPGPCRASLGGTTSLRSLTARWTFSSFSATRVLFVPFRDRPRHLLAQNQSGPSVAGTRRRA